MLPVKTSPVPKSATRTLRVDQDLDRAISERASKQNVSVNSLLNSLLRRYVDWDIPSAQLGYVIAPRLLLDELAKDRDEEKMEQVGRKVAKEFLKVATVYIYGELTATTAVELMRRASLYSGRFGFDLDEGQDSRSHVIIIRHEQGRMWSRYYLGLLDETFRVLLGEQVRTSYTDSLCVLQFSAS